MKPPTHKIAPLRIVADSDDAWDRDRINAELAGLEVEQLREHPVIAYHQGRTHFDLDALGTVYAEDGSSSETCARDYLRPEVVPRVFEARRLPPLEVATCLDRGTEVARVHAFRLAVKGIEGADGLTYHVLPTKAATEGQLQAVVDALGYDVMVAVGQAVLDASRSPNAAEGKRSGSPGGR